MVRLFWLILSMKTCHAAVSASLKEAARLAHEENPVLRKQEHERRVELEKKFMKESIPNERGLEDAQNAEYSSNQYNGYQYGQYQDWDPSMAEEEFGFDITGYSFKYTGCHHVGRTIKADGSPSRYATFRLCPTETCTGRSTFGCKKDYGEYVVPVDLLVTSLIQHNEARVIGYCTYCQHCAAIESYSQFSTEVLLHKEYILSYAQQRFSRWCSRTYPCPTLPEFSINQHTVA